MRLPFFAYPYKVTPTPTQWTEGWAGWRLRSFGVTLREDCECRTLDEEYHEDCPCYQREPHKHSYFGWLDRPIFAPNVKRPGMT